MDYSVLHSRATTLPFTSLNWLLLVLCIVIVIVVSFFLFYFNRLLAWGIAAVIRLALWKSNNVWVECEGFQLSLLAGRIFIKDLRYHSRNQSIRVLKCHITWRYWLWRTQVALDPTDSNVETESLLSSDKESNLPCRIHVAFEGLELFFYNRTPAFDEIISQLQTEHQNKPEAAPYPNTAVFEDPATRPRGFSLDDPEVHRNTRVTVATRDTAKSRMAWLTLGPFSRALKRCSEWVHLLLPGFQQTDILPISFAGRTFAIVAGNDSTPSILIAEAHKISGTYGVTACRSKLDLYKTVYSLKLTTVKIITRTNPDHQVSMIERGETIYGDLSQAVLDNHRSWIFLKFDSFRKLVKAYGELIRKATPKPPPKWRGLARYMTDAQRREAGELAHDVEYAKVTTILDTPALDVVYFVDDPGPVPEDARSMGGGRGGTVDVGNGDLPPEWGVELVMHGGTIIYGPWTDRQRDLIQKAFFPPAYVNRAPTARLSPGALRLHTVMTIDLELRDDATFRLPTREPSKDWKFEGTAPAADTRRKKDKRPFGWMDIAISQGSTLSYRMGMAADDNGYSTILEIHLKNPQLSSSVNGAPFWTNQACRILCEMPSPLQWDARRQWIFDLSFTSPTIHLLRDHTTLITDLIQDWTSGPPSDFNTFVPTDYALKFGFKDYRVNMYANDHNVIDHPLSDNINSLFVLTGPSLNAQVDVPSHKFRPHCRTTSFSVEGSKIEASMSLPDWNTYYVFANQRPLSLGNVGFTRLDGSYTSFAEVRPDYVEKLVLDVKARNVTYVNYTWAIRHFLRLKDNYFGRFTHFATFQEYSDRKARGLVGDPILAKYRKEKSNAFEVTLAINLLDNAMLLPQSIHGCRECLLVTAPELQLWLKLHDYFLELSFNLARAMLSGTVDRSVFARKATPLRQKGPRVMISSLDIAATRLFGPQPITATYLCLWEIKIGELKGVITPQFLTAASEAGRALSINYTDTFNAPDPKFELPLDPDVTFLSVSLESLDIVLKDLDSAAHVKLPDGFRLDFNDLAGKTYQRVLSLRLPLLQAQSLLRSPYKREDWFEVARASAGVRSDIYFSPPGWEESAARQLKFVLEQDSSTKRLKFLYSRDATTGVHIGDLFLPAFTSPEMRPEPRRIVTYRPTPRPRRTEQSESEGESLTEGERIARLSETRPITPGRSFRSASQVETDRSLSSDDESDDIAQSTPNPSSNSEAELSDVPSESSDSPRWPKFEHYHHVLNRYRASNQQSASDSTLFVLARDPMDVARWEPDGFSPTQDSSCINPEMMKGSLPDTNCRATVLVRVRSKRSIEVSVTPLVVSTVRSLLASFESCRPSAEYQLDSILGDFVEALSASYQDSPGRTVVDAALPSVKLSILQRVGPLRDEGSVVAGTPTQLLTAANLQMNNLSLFYAAVTGPDSGNRSAYPTKEFNLSLARIGLHLHTATSHPRSMPFTPNTLLFASIASPSITFGASVTVAVSLSFKNLQAQLGGKAPTLIATTFQSAIRFVSKVATSVKATSVRQLRRRRILVVSVLSSPQTSEWRDPLSRTQPSFIVKSGLPSKLRDDLSWKVIAYIRHRLREMDGTALSKLEDKIDRDCLVPSPAVQKLSSLLADQHWLDWALDGDQREPLLRTILYAPSPTADAVNTVLRSGLLSIQLGQMSYTILGSDSGDNTFTIGPISGRLQVGRKTLDSNSAEGKPPAEVLHLVAVVSIDTITIWMQPGLLPFLSEVLRVQRTASRHRGHHSTPKQVDSSPLPMIAEVTVNLESASLEASASKIVLEARSKVVSLSLTAERQVMTNRPLSAGLTLSVEEFRIGTKATPVGSKIAADQDTLAEVVVGGCSLNILAQETLLDRDFSLVLSQELFLINVPRSAMKLYHFFREWKMEYKSKYDMMVRDLVAEFERTPIAQVEPSASSTSKRQTYKIDVDLKRAQVLLQVMHGTWLSWEMSDTFTKSRGDYSGLLSSMFAVDVASQVINITGQQTDSSPATSIRLPLPRFGASGNLSPSKLVASVILGRFDIKVKPKYVDDILAIQQKFGSDFSELLDLYSEQRPTETLGGMSSTSTFRTSLKLSAKLDGFGISLEGPSSTQYLSVATVQGTVWSEESHGLTWDATVSSVSLSLAHHSTPTTARLDLDRRFRSAYMDIAFTANNRRPESSSTTDQYLQIQVSHVHAVMQAAAVGELGDLIDYVQAEMMLRKEQRATELAEIRKKGRLLRTKLEREPSAVEVSGPSSSWLDEQIVTIEVFSTGIAIPVSGDETVRPIYARSQSIGPATPAAVKAFLFSIASITFSSQRYQRGDLSIRDFALQFVPAFDQSRLEHFDGHLHNTNNRLRFPLMRAQMQMNRAIGRHGRSVTASAAVDGLELDLDPTIATYAFSAVKVYRKGKERIERIAPGQARANFEALSSRFASSEAMGSDASTISGSDWKVTLTFGSGRIRFFAPDHVVADRRQRRLLREMSSIADPLVASTSEGQGPTIDADVVSLPGLTIEAAFKGASATEKYASTSDGPPISYLNIAIRVEGSSNMIRPSILPFVVELMRNIERHMGESPTDLSQSGITDTSRQTNTADSSGIIPVAMAMKGRFQAHFTLAVGPSHLSLTCYPDVNVVAALDWDQSNFVMIISPNPSSLTLMGSVGGIQASVRHEFMRDKSFYAKAQDLPFTVNLYRDVQSDGGSPVPSLNVAMKTSFEGWLFFPRLQDLLCFKAIWLDRIPVFETRARPDTGGMSITGPVKTDTDNDHSSGSAFDLNISAILEKTVLEVDMGPSITKMGLEVQKLTVHRVQTLQESGLAITVDQVNLLATQSTSGSLHLPNLVFRTTRQIPSSTNRHGTGANRLEVFIKLGATELDIQHEQVEQLSFRADPMELQVKDDWADSSGGEGLRLDFTVKGGNIRLVGVPQAATRLIDTAANVKRLIRRQKEGAARDSSAFRTTLNPKPTNPLSEVAAAMLNSARERFQEEEVFDFTIVQHMQVDVESLQLAFVDGGKTFHLQANSISAQLERNLRTDASETKRDLHLALGSLVVLDFPAMTELAVSETTPRNATKVFTFPHLVIDMKSTILAERRELLYEFDCDFPTQEQDRSQTKVYLLLDLSEHGILVARTKDLIARVKRALDNPEFKRGDADWWDMPLRSNTSPDSGSISPRTVTSNSRNSLPPSLSKPGILESPKLELQAPPEEDEDDAASVPDSEPIVYVEKRCSIKSPEFQQFDKNAIRMETIESMLGINSRTDLPPKVHEYATIPIEGIMKLLLKVYAQRLRKGEGPEVRMERVRSSSQSLHSSTRGGLETPSTAILSRALSDSPSSHVTPLDGSTTPRVH